MSLISLAILSYDRYSTLMVCNKRPPDYRRPLLAVGGSWLYSLFWTVPPLLGWSSYGLEGAGTSCSVTWTEQTLRSHSYIICLFVFCLGLPVLVMVYCYGRLLYAVKQVRTQSVNQRETHNHTQSITERYEIQIEMWLSAICCLRFYTFYSFNICSKNIFYILLRTLFNVSPQRAHTSAKVIDETNNQ